MPHKKIFQTAILLMIFITTSFLPASAESGITISSSTHPDQNKWYFESTVMCSWTTSSPASGYNWIFDTTSNTVPDEFIKQTYASWYQTSILPDGRHYLHVRAKYASGWSETKHFRIQIDRTPPVLKLIEIDGGSAAGGAAGCFSTNAGVSVDAADDQSRVATLEIANYADFHWAMTQAYHYYNPWTLAFIDAGSPGDGINDSGTRSVYVRVYDEAGNVSLSKYDSISFTNLCGS